MLQFKAVKILTNRIVITPMPIIDRNDGAQVDIKPIEYKNREATAEMLHAMNELVPEFTKRFTVSMDDDVSINGITVNSDKNGNLYAVLHVRIDAKHFKAPFNFNTPKISEYSGNEELADDEAIDYLTNDLINKIHNLFEATSEFMKIDPEKNNQLFLPLFDFEEESERDEESSEEEEEE